MNKVAKNYLYNVAYQLLVLIAPIITSPYLARVLGAENLGIYSYVNSCGVIITTFSLLGIYTYGNRQTAYIRDDREALTSMFWELEIVRLLLGSVGTIFYFIYMYVNSEYTIYFLVYFPYILANFIDCSWLYVGLEDMQITVIKNFITKVINIIGIFLLVKTREDLWIYLMLLAITTLIANISIYTQLSQYIGTFTISIRNIPKHVKGSLSLFLPQVASLIYLQVDKVMLEWFTTSTSQISYYDQAEKIVMIPLSLITVISTVIMPRIANEYKKGHRENIEKILLKSGRFALGLGMPMFFGIILITRQFIPWYLGDEFTPTIIAIIILSPLIIINCLDGISSKQYLVATNQMKILFIAYSTCAIINILINTMLIPVFGYIGAAIATIIANSISVFIQYCYMLRHIKLFSLFRYGLKYGIGSFFMFLIVFFVTQNMTESIYTTSIQIIFGIFLYLIYLLIIKDQLFYEGIDMLLKLRNKM